MNRKEMEEKTRYSVLDNTLNTNHGLKIKYTFHSIDT